jgi:hypothetical protein
MNPEEKALLLETAKLTEENNLILKKLQSATRRAAIYGFIRLAIILLPLIIGYFFLQPYLGTAAGGIKEIQSLLDTQY